MRSLLTRWLRRKGNDTLTEEDRQAIADQTQSTAVKKDESNDNQPLSESAVPELDRVKQLALKIILSNQKWSMLDGMNEYDEDYTNFTLRGNLLTEDMIYRLQTLVDGCDGEGKNPDVDFLNGIEDDYS